MLGIVLCVFVAAWVALLLHELGHAAMARLLGVRIWSITLGGGPSLWTGTVGDCRVRAGFLPIHGEVRLRDGDAYRLGYQDLAGAPARFEWMPGLSWRAALISAAGGLMNFAAATVILAQWNVTRNPQSAGDVLVLCVLLTNALMVLNLMPIRGLDGWRLALHAAAWRRSRSGSRAS
jgi:membrane-associated protease RseP (regulator of RpoE activity)